ncbi:MAG: purine-nucleoside phosphorylase [Sphaerochaetaceae bacterium]
MVSSCIGAKKGEIAKTVLMPGDPLRAKFIAEKYLDNVKLINEVRGMLGYTGDYKGKTVTVMGSGMGIPSIGLYSYELYDYFDVDSIIRIGSVGASVPELDVFDVVLVTSSYSTSVYAKEMIGYTGHILKGDRGLEKRIEKMAKKLNIPIHKGRVMSNDTYFKDITEKDLQIHKDKKIIGVEMEFFGLCANAIKLNKKAACLLTVSDSIVTHKETTALERQTAFENMIKIALEAAE